MEALTPTHLLFILIGFIVLFGYKKLPDASRSLGRSLRIFKSEMRSMSEEEPAEPKRGASFAAEPEAEAAAAEAHAAALRRRAADTHGA